MYPLLLKAPVKDYLWGGTRLITDFGFETDKEIAAEAWVLSCHKDGTSTVLNGACTGQALTMVLEDWGAAALGARAAAFPYFPLLIKLIDAPDRLSVQVHPDNAYAQRVEGEFGKTEMWYIVDCEPDAQLIYGFKQSIPRAEFRTRIEDNTLTDVVNFVPVHKGDVFFIPAGTLHAIGAGILIAEVQQNSNTTYRVSDYGRLGADGKPRPLHVDKAVEVTDTVPPREAYGAVGETVRLSGGTLRPLSSCEFFTAELLALHGTVHVGVRDSFTSLVCLEGEATLTAEGCEPLLLQKGASVFLPAGLSAAVSGNASLLCSRV
ncbi:MAG: class I mannose-6-phosphate isomerase [Clostridia bacterium]|nr:class I mannose-6-phosphate isomerase [Clostridia bacterium]